MNHNSHFLVVFYKKWVFPHIDMDYAKHTPSAPWNWFNLRGIVVTLKKIWRIIMRSYLRKLLLQGINLCSGESMWQKNIYISKEQFHGVTFEEWTFAPRNGLQFFLSHRFLRAKDHSSEVAPQNFSSDFFCTTSIPCRLSRFCEALGGCSAESISIGGNTYFLVYIFCKTPPKTSIIMVHFQKLYPSLLFS